MAYAYCVKSPETVNILYTALLFFMGHFGFIIFFSLILILCKKEGKVHPCTGTEALYRPYGP